MQYYVNLKINNQLQPHMKKIIQKLELSTYEERFCIEDECIEVYKVGTIDECENFIKNISDVKLQREFEITKINEK